MSFDDFVICSPLRTPVGRFGGVAAPLSAADLASGLPRELADRTGLEEGAVDDVILGQCYPDGEAPAVGRILVTLAHELRRRDGRYALETMCIGGGQGLAAIFEAA